MDFVGFLKEALPPMGLAPKPHNRKGVRRRLTKRMDRLGIHSWEDYLERLRHYPEEKEVFAQLVNVTVTKFFRDVQVFEAVEKEVLPALMEQTGPNETTAIWSAGCANGEEPYSVAMIWDMHFQGRRGFVIDAQDPDPQCLDRAGRRRYPLSSIKNVPLHYRDRYFHREGEDWVLSKSLRRWVDFYLGDLETPPSAEPYHAVFCRNSIFTYGSQTRQEQSLERIKNTLKESGYLVIGKKETLPSTAGWRELKADLGIYQKCVQRLVAFGARRL